MKENEKDCYGAVNLKIEKTMPTRHGFSKLIKTFGVPCTSNKNRLFTLVKLFRLLGADEGYFKPSSRFIIKRKFKLAHIEGDYGPFLHFWCKPRLEKRSSIQY